MPAIIKKPQLTNRGASGLLTKVVHKEGEPKLQRKSGPELWESAPKDRIRCEGVVVDISTLCQDPNNANTHPDRNMEAIKNSLALHGQTTPLVVRRDGMIIVAGNGRHLAAVELGWTKLACSILDMDDGEAAAYGLTDNRTAQLAKWDFEVVARLEKLITETGHEMVGWSDDELSVLRAADWSPPAIDNEFGTGNGEVKPFAVKFEKDEADGVRAAVDYLKQIDGEAEHTDALAIAVICDEWLAARKLMDGVSEEDGTDKEEATVGSNGSV